MNRSNSNITSNFSSYSSSQNMSQDKTFLKNRSINMLSVAISTVMLMASKKNISDEYYKWTERYLKCIKDGHGHHPPNIEKILQMIDKLNAKKEEEDKCRCSQIIPPFGGPAKV